MRIGDDFYAIGDRCSHEDFSLSEGEVWADECELECPQHGSTFDLRTGAACTLPATKPVPVYAVELVATTSRWCCPMSLPIAVYGAVRRLCRGLAPGGRAEVVHGVDLEVRARRGARGDGAQRVGQEHPGPCPHGPARLPR